MRQNSQLKSQQKLYQKLPVQMGPKVALVNAFLARDNSSAWENSVLIPRNKQTRKQLHSTNKIYNATCFAARVLRGFKSVHTVFLVLLYL